MDMNEALKDYTLYAIPFNANGIEEAPKHKFYKISVSNEYILVYSDKDVRNGLEIHTRSETKLCTDDKQWLDYCRKLLVIDYIKDNPQTVEENNLRFLKELEEQLDELAKRKE